MKSGWPERKNYLKTGGVYTHNDAKAPLGQGGRFAALKSKLSKQPGVTDPAALAASIGRKKLGKSRFQKLAAAGRAG